MGEPTNADVVRMLKEDIAKLEYAYLQAVPDDRDATYMAGSMFATLRYITSYFEKMKHFRQVFENEVRITQAERDKIDSDAKAFVADVKAGRIKWGYSNG